MRSPWTCVLWDVDGTVVDASDGILRRLTTTLEHFGYPAPTRAELVHWIGPPMFESFQVNLGMTPEQSTDAVAYYQALSKADTAQRFGCFRTQTRGSPPERPLWTLGPPSTGSRRPR